MHIHIEREREMPSGVLNAGQEFLQYREHILYVHVYVYIYTDRQTDTDARRSTQRRSGVSTV